MWFSDVCIAFVWATGLALATPSVSNIDLMVNTRHGPGKSSSDTVKALGRALTAASRERRNNIFTNHTSIEKSWTDATLLTLEQDIRKGNVAVAGSVEVICTRCYVKAKATAQLTVNGSFNATAAFNNVTEQIIDDFENITTTVVDYVEGYVGKTFNALSDGIQASDFALPPVPNLGFQIDIPDIPEAILSFQFDDLELYVQLNTVFSGDVTYNLNLYTSKTPIGLSIGDEVTAGVVFTVDLILSAGAEVDISSGFHIKLDDGVAFDIALFGQNVTDTTFNGGKFEFLPVALQGVSALITAVLRVGVQAGFELELPNSDLVDEAFDDALDISAGIMVGVFVHIAEFTTNVTLAPAGDSGDCVLRVEESYQLAIGAVAGATVAIDDHTWGPVPATTVPVYFTTIADACASSKTSTSTVVTVSTKEALNGRQIDDLTTTTLRNTEIYTGIQCLSTGLVNCPASLQTTAITSSVQSLVTAVASGVDATWPLSVLSSVPTTIAFGAAVRDLFQTSGTPTSYVPSPSSIGDDVKNLVNGVDKRIIIGVSVGVGGALVLAIVGCVCFFHRRRRYAAIPVRPPPMVVAPSTISYTGGYDGAKKTPTTISVSPY